MRLTRWKSEATTSLTAGGYKDVAHDQERNGQYRKPYPLRNDRVGVPTVNKGVDNGSSNT